MSRRDTIIIAVLVNAAILLILFATAMRSDSKKSKEEATPLVKEEVTENLDNAVAANLPENPIDDQAIEILGGDETEVPMDSSLTNADTAIPPVVTSTAPAPSAQPGAVKKETTKAIPAAPAPVQSIAQSPANPREETISVTVKKGDALEKIARANHSTVAAITRANNLTSTQLKIGQVLKVPTGEKATPAAPIATAAVTAVKKEIAQGTKQPISAPLAQVAKQPISSVATTMVQPAKQPLASTATSTAPKQVAPSVAQPAKSASAPSSDNFYTVKEGDNPWLIASRMGIKLEDLLRLNGMDNEKAKRLRPGDKLRIR